MNIKEQYNDNELAQSGDDELEEIMDLVFGDDNDEDDN